jgi:hypothetical protein
MEHNNSSIERYEMEPQLALGGVGDEDRGGKGQAMTEAEALAELTRLENEFGQMTEKERRHFENLLYLRAMVHGWTGDPLCQPATSVLACYQQMRAESGKLY